MKTVIAYMNSNRWLVKCPKQHGGDMPAGDEYICPVCYPGIIASYFVVRNGRVMNIPDKSARATARKMAGANGEIYRVKFPANKAKIEQALEILPQRRRHWSGKGIKELSADAKREAHLLDNYNKRDKKLDGSNPVIVVTRGK